MSIRIGSNISSLQAQRQLSRTTESLNATMERLASGMRINRASDDAAGLAIADSLKSSTRVYTQATKNISDGISALSIAEGALQQLSEITIRQSELAEQAANGVYTLKQRKALQSESDALTEEYNRITQTTKFNGINLFGKDAQQLRLQVGYGIEESIKLNLAQEIARKVATGEFDTSFMQTGGVAGRGVELVDLNNDGKLDIVATSASGTLTTLLGNGDGTFMAARTFTVGGTTAGSQSIIAADLNGDGRIDLAVSNGADYTVSILYGNGDGTFQAQQTYQVDSSGTTSNFLGYEDMNGDGKKDLISDSSILLSNGNGTFTTLLGVLPRTGYGVLGDFDGDGRIDSLESFSTNLRVWFSNGDGTFRPGVSQGIPSHVGARVVGDFNRDGLDDVVISENDDQLSVYFSNGDGSFRLAQTLVAPAGTFNVEVVDLNDDGILDFYTQAYTGTTSSVYFGNANGSFSNGVTQANTGGASYAASFGDINNDGVIDVVHSGSGQNILISRTEKSAHGVYLDLLSQDSARIALDTSRKVLNRINQELGSIGATQSRLRVAYDVTSTRILAEKEAESRIRDADIAEEVAQLTKNRILQNVAAAILGQANQQPGLAVELLKR